MRILASLIAVLLAVVATDALAQVLSIEDIARIAPDNDRDNKPIVRHRWHDGRPINVVVITDGQRDPCVSAAIRQIQDEVDRLHQDLPELKIASKVAVMDWVPNHYDAPMLLIALPTENRRIARALLGFARVANPKANFIAVSDSHGMSHGVGRIDDPPGVGAVSAWESERIQGIEGGFVVHGHNWTVNQRGMEYLTGSCGWLWSFPLLQLLGADHLNISYKWSEAMQARGFKQPDQLVQRLFLRALYSRPGASVDREAILRTFMMLMNEPSALPVPYEKDR